MRFRNEYWFLSNMYPCQITYNGMTYSCVESAFQAQKDPSSSAWFVGLNGFEAKKLGRRVVLRPDWDRVKLDIMKNLLEIKFSDPELKSKLSAVHEFIAEDNDWNDTYWGMCHGHGCNKLGLLLMEIRG